MTLKKNKYCIIGSGIGGGTLIKKLLEKGQELIIVEAGEQKGNSVNVNYENVGLDFGVRSTTNIQVGGTSNLWHGVLAPLDKLDFEKRDYIPHSGWPIGLKDLIPFYKEAAELLGVNNYDYFQEEELSKEYKEQLQKLPFNRNYLENKLFQQPVPPLNFKNVVNQYVKEYSEQIIYYENNPALELIYSEYGKIEKVKLGKKNGETFTVEADVFIVCTGALETPRLLLNSNIQNKNIGKYLMDHPMGNLCQLEFLKPDKFPIYSDMKYNSSMKIKTGFEIKDILQKELRLPNHCFYLRPSFVKGIDNKSEKIKLSLLSFKDRKVSLKDVFNVLTNMNIIRQILIYKMSLNVIFKYADLFFVTEQIPNPKSTVSLSEKKDKWGYPISKVNWQIIEEDIYNMKKYYKLILEDFFPKEHYSFSHTLNDFNWKSIFTSAIHHVGTARMSDNNEKGVVDKNLKVFDHENLYICDGSVFTTSGNVNNGLTISALACRLASFLTNLNQ